MIFSAVKYLNYINLFARIKNRARCSEGSFSIFIMKKMDFKETCLCKNGIYFVLLFQ